jgi:hypothetical protein
VAGVLGCVGSGMPEMLMSGPLECCPKKYPAVNAAKANVTDSRMAVMEFFIEKRTSFIDSVPKNWYNLFV